MRKYIWIYIFSVIVVFTACFPAGNNQSGSRPECTDSVKVEFAQGFSIRKFGDISLLTVSDPWQGARNIRYHYVLSPRGASIPPEFSGYPVIYTPVERVVCLSTTHIAMLSALGKENSIKGISGPDYISDPVIRQAVADGRILDVGYDQALNYERIITLKPDVIFAYGVGGEAAGSLSRLTDLGLKVVINAEYLEQTALAKAEWMKFMAMFYNSEEDAIRKFNGIRDEYLSLSALTREAATRPTVLCGLPWQGIWYIPGGKTSIAALIEDAGGDYLWKENDSRESIPLHIEGIINKSSNSDIWINTGAARSFPDIKSVDERLVHLKPFTTGMIYNNYARMGAGGGNDFFESGVVNPHMILKDMIRIFHPDLLPDHDLYYYMKLNN